MKLLSHPAASSKEMFTNVSIEVATIHKMYRNKLDDLKRKEDGQLPGIVSSDPTTKNCKPW